MSTLLRRLVRDYGPAMASKIDEALDDLAERIISDLRANKVSLDQALEAFKILSAYQLGIAKVKKGLADPDDDVPKFDSFRERIQKVSSNG